MIVRAFHMALYRLEKDGTSTLIPYQEEKQISWEYSNGRLVPFSDGWTIDKPRSEYRFYNVVIEITPKAQAELSSDHFLQFTMDAIGQDEVSKAIYVRNWSEPNSPISLKPFEIFSPGAQKELTRLHKQLRSYEKTNEDLGRRLSQSDKAHKAEVKEVRLALRTNERELEDTGKRVNELKKEKQALDGALQNAEKQISQWEWLTSQAEQQKTAISEHIKVSVELGDMILTGLNPTVRFGIKIVNKSFLDISLAPNLDEHVNGKIDFTGYQSITLHGSKIVLYTAKDIPPGGGGHLTIEQRLIDNDPRIINDGNGWPDGRFDLSALDIEIVGGKNTPDITGMPLEMKNVTVSAFSANLLERGQRIRAMAEVRGSAEQLHEALRVAEKPLPKEVFEHWEEASRSFLEKVYEPAALIRVWEQITDQTPIPGTAPSQRAWLSSRIVKMGAFLAELTGEYVNRTTLNS